MPNISKALNGVSVEERRRQVKFLYDNSCSLAEIGRLLEVPRMVVRTDIGALGLDCYSALSELEVLEVVKDIILDSHRSAGLRYITGQLRARNLRLQRWRIRKALIDLGALRAPPRRIRRQPWYEAYGPNW